MSSRRTSRSCSNTSTASPASTAPTPRTAPRRRYSPPAATARRAASYDDDDDGETYEAAWRRRRVATLKAAPELSVDEVQDLFEPDYLQKRLYERSPESAFGAVFRLEGVVADVEGLPAFVDAWTAVAAEFDYAPPSARDVDYVLRAGVRTEVAVDSVFRWTRDWGAARAGPRGRRRDEGAGACAQQSSDDGPHLLK